MKHTAPAEEALALQELCCTARSMINRGQFKGCFELLSEALGKYPHAPHPHNLFGILLEKTGNHSLAMKHFRAAYDLDSSYFPAAQNLMTFGTFRTKGPCAYDESDCTFPPADRQEHRRKEKEGY